MNPDHRSDEAPQLTASGVLWESAASFARDSDSLVAHAYEQLWKQIVEGERQPGERLVDAELVAELGISRTPIRHALYQLQQAGLVEANPRRGFHVVIFSAEEVRDLYDLRTILEVAATRLAVPKLPTEVLLAALDELLRLQNTPEPAVGPQFLMSDVRFHHDIIAGHSGNRQLVAAVAQQRARMSVFLVGGTRLPGGNSKAMAEHETIVRALLERNAELAAQAMEHHIQRVKNDTLDALAGERRPRVRRLRPDR